MVAHDMRSHILMPGSAVAYTDKQGDLRHGKVVEMKEQPNGRVYCAIETSFGATSQVYDYSKNLLLLPA